VAVDFEGRLIQRYRLTIFFGVPTLYAA